MFEFACEREINGMKRMHKIVQILREREREIQERHFYVEIGQVSAKEGD